MWEGQKWEDEGMWEGQKWEWEGAEGGNMRLLVMDAPTELSQVNLIKLFFITNGLSELFLFKRLIKATISCKVNPKSIHI